MAKNDHTTTSSSDTVTTSVTSTVTTSVTQTHTKHVNTASASSSTGTDSSDSFSVSSGPTSPPPSPPAISATSTVPAAPLSSSATSAPNNSSSHGSSGASIAIGILVAFLILGVLAVLSYLYVRRRWRRNNARFGPGGALTTGDYGENQWSMYEAASTQDPDRGGYHDTLRGGEIGVYGDTGAKRPEARRTTSSSTSKMSFGLESPRSRSLRIGRQRTSIGLDHEPEAYTMFGSSTASLGLYQDEDPYVDRATASGPKIPPGLGYSRTAKGKDREDGNVMEMGQMNSSPANSPPTHGRQSSFGDLGGDTTKGERRRSLLQDSSKYPSMSSVPTTSSSRRMSRASVSETFDPFSDKTPPSQTPEDEIPKIPGPPPGAMKSTNPFQL